MKKVITDRWYFGKDEFEKYGDYVYNALKGRGISKRVDLADDVCGLRYEAKMLDMDMFDLLSTIEGLCYNGMAYEYDDSTYIIGKPGVDFDEFWKDDKDEEIC